MLVKLDELDQSWGLENTRYGRRGGCGADEIEAVIRRHERPA